ncbi:MAG: GNAT family N-acetyltransferase [Hyphomicrobiaceae bacterium]
MPVDHSRASVAFRCDAGAEVGAGHVMRCMAGAEMFAWANWDVRICTSATGLPAASALVDDRFEVTSDSDWWSQARVAVLDSHRLDSRELLGAQRSGTTTVVFEDQPNRDIHADILVDPTPNRDPEAYRAYLRQHALLLVGVSYAQLGVAWRQMRAKVSGDHFARKDVERIVVSLGATDPYNLTCKVLQGLKESGYKGPTDVVLSVLAPHIDKVRELLGPNDTLHISPPDLPEIHAAADLAIGASGSSCFERACIGIPSVAIPVVDNQSDLASSFAARGAAEVVSRKILDEPRGLATVLRTLMHDAEKRAKLSSASREMVDGQGSRRLLIAAIGTATTKTGEVVGLRAGDLGDQNWLFALQNQPETRRYALNPDKPTFEAHCKWLASTLDNPDRLLAIVEVDRASVGMLRLDKETTAAQASQFTISIAMDQNFKRRGFAAAALRLARRLTPGAEQVATVLEENKASAALFMQAGFVQEGPSTFRMASA